MTSSWDVHGVLTEWCVHSGSSQTKQAESKPLLAPEPTPLGPMIALIMTLVGRKIAVTVATYFFEDLLAPFQKRTFFIFFVSWLVVFGCLKVFCYQRYLISCCASFSSTALFSTQFP